MKDDFKDLTFNLEDFEDYKKEIEEIKELYTGLMKKKSNKIFKKSVKKRI